jgi:hypothetical protein
VSAYSLQLQDDFSASRATRPPPLVLHVRPGTRVRPPPEPGGGAVLILGILAAIVIVIGVTVLVLHGWPCALPVLIVGLFGFALAVAPRGFFFGPTVRAWTSGHFVELARPAGSDPRLKDLAKQWKRFFTISKESRETIFAQAPRSDAGTVLCVGAVEVPDILDLPFEPFIITPTQYVWRQLVSVGLAAAVLSVWLLSWTRVIPAWVRPNLIGFWWLAFSGLSVAATWFWRSTIRPRYIRLAPGIVQVLEYSLFGRHQATRSYEMCAGTTVLVQQLGRARQPTRLMFRCGTRKDVFDLPYMRDPAAVTEAFWRAMLSTAPRPPLSDDELIG